MAGGRFCFIFVVTLGVSACGSVEERDGGDLASSGGSTGGTSDAVGQPSAGADSSGTGGHSEAPKPRTTAESTDAGSSSTGGAGTGGGESGGTATGGAGTGGSATGGAGVEGTASGDAATGGAADGGTTGDGSSGNGGTAGDGSGGNGGTAGDGSGGDGSANTDAGTTVGTTTSGTPSFTGDLDLATYPIDPDALEGCRSPQQANCERCCVATEFGSCYYKFWSEQDAEPGEEPWYNAGGTDEGVVCPDTCIRCARCTLHDEEAVRTFEEDPECDCATVPVVNDPCFGGGCPCYCEKRERKIGVCPPAD